MELDFTIRPAEGIFDIPKLLEFLDTRTYAAEDPRKDFLMDYLYRYIVAKDGASLKIYLDWAQKREKFLLGGVVLISEDEIAINQENYTLGLLYKMRGIVEFILNMQPCKVFAYDGKDISEEVNAHINYLYPVEQFEQDQQEKKEGRTP